MWLAAVRAELCGQDGYEVGVGPVRAAARAAALFAAHRPTWAVLVGSAGVYGDRRPIGSGHVTGTQVWADGASVAGLAYSPLAPPPIVGLVPGLPAGAPAVVTVPSITSDTGLADQLGRLGDLEHLEAYAVAHAALEAGVPLLIALGVSNRVGPGAHAEWVANRAQAERAAVDAAIAFLGAWPR